LGDAAGLKVGNGPFNPVGLGVLRDFFIGKNGYTKKKDQGSRTISHF